MRLDSLIRIDLDQESPVFAKAWPSIKKELTYPNPKFQDAARLGFSIRAIPKDIKTYRESSDGKRINILRGEIGKLAFLPGFDFADHTLTLRQLHSMIYMNEDFQLDERQQRCLSVLRDKKQGIIHAATSAGKSAMIMAAIAERGQPALVIVSREILLSQLLEDAEKYLHGCTIGKIGGGDCVIGDVTFAIDKTLLNILEREDGLATSNPEAPSLLRNKFGMVICDEVHGTPANTFQQILSRLPARYRYGFTGTLKRKDRMEFLMFASFGKVIVEITRDEIEEAGRAMPVQIVTHELETTVSEGPEDEKVTDKWRRVDNELHENPERLDFLGELAQGMFLDGKTAAFAFRYLRPLEQLSNWLTDYDVPHEIMIGETIDKLSVCKRLQSGESKILLATIGCFGTGVNIPNLTDLVLASPVHANELMLHQLRGRVARMAEGKTEARMHVLNDVYVHPPQRFRKMMNILRA